VEAERALGVGATKGVGVGTGAPVVVVDGVATRRSRCCCVGRASCALSETTGVKPMLNSKSNATNLEDGWFLILIFNEACLEFQGES
jgi:hypothetical protein